MDTQTDAAEIVAMLMAASARSAPKAKGADSIETKVLGKNSFPHLATAMERLADELQLVFFRRDAENIRASDACLLIGCREGETAGMNCQGCGYPSCRELEDSYGMASGQGPFRGPNCILKITDLGIAVGSAVKTASLHNIDNRVMYSVGVAALSLGYLPQCNVAYGIPLSVKGKNIYFDR